MYKGWHRVTEPTCRTGVQCTKKKEGILWFKSSEMIQKWRSYLRYSWDTARCVRVWLPTPTWKSNRKTYHSWSRIMIYALSTHFEPLYTIMSNMSIRWCCVKLHVQGRNLWDNLCMSLRRDTLVMANIDFFVSIYISIISICINIFSCNKFNVNKSWTIYY